MNVKKAIIIGSLAAATILPFSSNGQTKKQTIVNKANKELSTAVNKEIIDHNGKRISIKESYEEIVNMPIKTMQEKYKENTECIFSFYMLEEINKRRETLGVKPLIYDATLERICKNFSKYMAEKKKIGHEIDKKNSYNPTDGDKYKILRENIAHDNTKYATISGIINIRQFLDDKNDKTRGEKREERQNHKYPIIADDVDKFGCYFSIVEENIYIVMESGKLF